MIILNKTLGQYLLINKKIIKKIVFLIKPQKTQNILEIGSGTGLLTEELCKYVNYLNTIEIDANLIKIFKKKKIKNVKTINYDILKFNFLKLFKKKKIQIVGNIPYYISNEIIYKFIKYRNIIKNIYITVQKEFAISLIYNKKKNTKLSLLTKIFFDVKILLKIKKNNFLPQPKINSVLIKIKPNENIQKINIKNYQKIKHITNNIFFKKNRKLKNNLKRLINKNNILKTNININKRPNKLNLNEYTNLINFIFKSNNIK